MPHPFEIVTSDGTTDVIEITCRMCHEIYSFNLPVEQVQARRAGNAIQDCFPTLPPEHRELFISGTCPSCYNELLAQE